MKKNTAFPKVSRNACIISLLFLAAIFIFPAGYLAKMADYITAEGEQARLAIMDGEQQNAQAHIINMMSRFEEDKDTIKLFFHHEDIDEMERALISARDLAALDESDNLICELNCILQLADHMRSVENAGLSDLF